MADKCEKCGGELADMHRDAIRFYPPSTLNDISPRGIPVICNCCKQCGHIQDIRAKNPEKLT